MSDPQATLGASGAQAARRERLPAGPWLAAAIVDLVAVALLVTLPLTARVAFGTAALHLLALVPTLISRDLSCSEKALGTAYLFALPVAGALLAVMALGSSGRGELDMVQGFDPEAGAVSEPFRVEDLRRLGEALPLCEALLAGGTEERRGIIATLTRRADADAVALLRWALGAADPELAVEAALAIEEMTADFEARLRECRAELASDPSSAEAALACAELVTQAIGAGIADAAVVPKLAHEARHHFMAADDGDPARAIAVAVGRARLELEILRPDTALACIDEALGRVAPEGRPPLLALREEAVLASHALPWEGPSALATYQHAGVVPPPLTAGRRFGTGRALPARGRTGGVNIGPVRIPPLASTQKVRRDGR